MFLVRLACRSTVIFAAPIVVLNAIGFGLADYLPQVEAGQPFSACYTLEMNEYRGFRNVQLRLLDLRWE